MHRTRRGCPAATCIFNDVTIGTNAVPGETNYNSSSETYLAGVGFDRASGLGSVNVTNLVNNWVTTVGVPTAVVSPSALTFAQQADGTTSASQTVTLSNNGTAALSISNIAISGTNASDFASANTCGAALGAGSSCTISATFTPAAAGSRSASLVVTDNSGNVTGSTQTVALSGTGSSSTTPTTFTTYLGTYGSARPAYSGATVILPLRAYLPSGASQLTDLQTNLTATGGAVEYEIVAQSDGAGNYLLHVQNSTTSTWPELQLSPSGSTVTLATPVTLGAVQITAYRFALAGNELQLDVTVTRAGTFSDQIVILGVSGTNYSSPWYGVDGQWSGTAANAPAVTLSTTNLTFGSQALGSSATQTITVTNSGSSVLTISSAQVGGANPGDFTIGNACTGSVSAGGACTLSVTFDPLAAGGRSATLNLADNAANSPQSVALSGTGSSAATPPAFTTYLGTYGSGQPTYSGAAVILPLRAYIPAGASQLSVLQTNLTATSGSAVEYEIGAQSDGAGNYLLHLQNSTTSTPWPQLQLNPSGSTVTLATPITLGSLQITAYRFALVGSEFQLDVTVTRSGTFSDQIVILGISGNNYSSPWFGIDGQWGSTAANAPAVTLSTTNLNFGSQSVGSSASQTIKVTNSGSAALTISTAQVSGTNPGDFTIGNSCSSSVAIGGSCNILVTFDPLAAGTRSATLSITDNATNSPQSVALSGTGSSAATPTAFTTYLGTYGSGQQTYHGTAAVIPLRAYLPAGASQMTELQTNLTATSGGAVEYEIGAQSDGSGNYLLYLENSTTSTWPQLQLVPSGATITLATPITLGTMQITAYRFALAGNEFQLDVTVSRTGTFSDQIVILGISGTNYSSPWFGVDGQWTNP